MISLFSTFTTISPYDNTFPLEPAAPNISSSINSITSSMIGIIQIIAYGLGFLGFVAAIALLVKVILDRKKINEEMSESTINKVKLTSILLLIVNILSYIHPFVN